MIVHIEIWWETRMECPFHLPIIHIRHHIVSSQLIYVLQIENNGRVFWIEGFIYPFCFHAYTVKKSAYHWIYKVFTFQARFFVGGWTMEGANAAKYCVQILLHQCRILYIYKFVKIIYPSASAGCVHDLILQNLSNTVAIFNGKLIYWWRHAFVWSPWSRWQHIISICNMYYYCF